MKAKKRNSKITVVDNGTPGATKDIFELKIDGLTVVSGTLAGGNIVIH